MIRWKRWRTSKIEYGAQLLDAKTDGLRTRPALRIRILESTFFSSERVIAQYN